VQLSEQQQAASDATQALAAREQELQQLKATNTTEGQAWQARAEELKEVCAIKTQQMEQPSPCSGCHNMITVATA